MLKKDSCPKSIRGGLLKKMQSLSLLSSWTDSQARVSWCITWACQITARSCRSDLELAALSVFGDQLSVAWLAVTHELSALHLWPGIDAIPVQSRYKSQICYVGCLLTLDHCGKPRSYASCLTSLGALLVTLARSTHGSLNNRHRLLCRFATMQAKRCS